MICKYISAASYGRDYICQTIHSRPASGFYMRFSALFSVSYAGYDGYYVQNTIANHDFTISLFAAIYSIEPSGYHNNRFLCTFFATVLRQHVYSTRNFVNVFLRFHDILDVTFFFLVERSNSCVDFLAIRLFGETISRRINFHFLWYAFCSYSSSSSNVIKNIPTESCFRDFITRVRDTTIFET